MSVKLKQRIRQYLMVTGYTKGKARLSLETGLSVRMIEKIVKESTYTPRPDNAYLLERALDRLSKVPEEVLAAKVS